MSRNEWNQFVNEFFGEDVYKAYNRITPNYDFEDKGDSYQLEIALPGYSKSDLDLKFEDSVITVSHDTNKPSVWKKSFKRKYGTPNDVDAKEIEAKMEDGVLLIKLPKLKEKRPVSVKIY